MSSPTLESLKASGLCPTCGNEICQCGFEVEPLPPLKERLEQEREQRVERVERLSRLVETLFPGDRHEEVRREIRRSFNVPQKGMYHNEGMYMDTHLDRILQTIDDLYAGRFPKGASQALKEVLRSAVQETPKEMFQQYAFLHDIDKPTTLSLKNTDGVQTDVTWDEWEAMLPPGLAQEPDPVALDVFLREQNVESISYYHGEEKHGDKGADTVHRLKVEIPETIVQAIRKHEAGFLFQTINTGVYEKHFASFSPMERDWAIVASYTDLMGSYQSREPDTLPSKTDIALLDHLINSKRNFEIIERLQVLIAGDEEIRGWKERAKDPLKDTRLQQSLNELKSKIVPLEAEDVLLASIKNDVAPKLLTGEKMGKLIQYLQKEFGREGFQPVRKALLAVKETEGIAGVQAALAGVPMPDEAKRTEIQKWIVENMLTGNN